MWFAMDPAGHRRTSLSVCPGTVSSSAAATSGSTATLPVNRRVLADMMVGSVGSWFDFSHLTGQPPNAVKEISSVRQFHYGPVSLQPSDVDSVSTVEPVHPHKFLNCFSSGFLLQASPSQKSMSPVCCWFCLNFYTQICGQTFWVAEYQPYWMLLVSSWFYNTIHLLPPLNMGETWVIIIRISLESTYSFSNLFCSQIIPGNWWR